MSRALQPSLALLHYTKIDGQFFGKLNRHFLRSSSRYRWRIINYSHDVDRGICRSSSCGRLFIRSIVKLLNARFVPSRVCLCLPSLARAWISTSCNLNFKRISGFFFVGWKPKDYREQQLNDFRKDFRKRCVENNIAEMRFWDKD